jgi:diguanylate cyclase (GGDEF)-like protein
MLRLLNTRGRIILLVILAALPALGLTIFSTWDERARAAVQEQDNLRRLASLAAQRQEQIIEGARQTLVAISLAPASVHDDQASCNAFLANLLAHSSGIYHSMGIYNADAVLICNAVPWQGKIMSPDRLYLRLPMSSGKFTIGEYQIGRVTGLQGINLGYPIKDSTGNVSGVAFVAVDLARLNRIAASTPMQEKAIVTIVDRDGVILARHPDIAGRVGKKLATPKVWETVLSGTSGVFQIKASDGVERLWAYDTVAGNPDGVIALRVLVSIPMDVVFAAADRALLRNLIGIALATALLLIAAWYGTEVFVLRKIRLLLNAAGRVHAGDLSARTGLLRTGDDLSQLGAAFDGMTQALQDRDAELEQVIGKLSEHATTDPLTGLYNRRYLLDFLHREIERAGRSATRVSAIMLDLDHFKRVNDTFGHAAGDLILTQVAGLLKQHVRGSDMVCRYGGEEFVLILPGASLAIARHRAENIRAAVNNLEMSYNDQPLGVITASLGIALFPEHSSDAAGLLHAADTALYRAKNEGRNRVEIAAVSIPSISPGTRVGLSKIVAARYAPQTEDC